MDAIILFSGGKDSVMAFKKAQENGYNIVAGFTYLLTDAAESVVDSNVPVKIAESAGINNYSLFPFTYAQIAATSLTQLITEQLNTYRTRFPSVRALVLGADASQSVAMFLFYLRIAHAADLTVYVPYADCYETEFFNDLRSHNLEIRLMKFPDNLANPPAINRGDILPIDLLEQAFLTNNLPLVSETQTLVTNASFFSSPVQLKVVNGKIQLQ